MRALTIKPSANEGPSVRELPEPSRRQGELLVEGLLVGVCGTDREIMAGTYGEAPPGDDYLILGHEALGRVREADAGSPFLPGDHVVGIVRRPDPKPCACCAAGEWDMCLTGDYTERGIRGAHGYAAERYTLEADFAIKVPGSLGSSLTMNPRALRYLRIRSSASLALPAVPWKSGSAKTTASEAGELLTSFRRRSRPAVR